MRFRGGLDLYLVAAWRPRNARSLIYAPKGLGSNHVITHTLLVGSGHRERRYDSARFSGGAQPKGRQIRAIGQFYENQMPFPVNIGNSLLADMNEARMIFPMKAQSPRGVLLLMGGGIDSSYLALRFAKTKDLRSVYGLHFDYGQPACHPERRSAISIAKLYDIPLITAKFRLGMSESGPELKGRNLLFLIAAAPYALANNCDQLAIGVHDGTGYYDATQLFINNGPIKG